jgi:hypothetical protein
MISFTLWIVFGSPVFYQVENIIRQRYDKEEASVRALSKSSLILAQGFPFIEANLMTIFNGLLFANPWLDSVSKSFVKKVPIPNATVAREIRVTTRKNLEAYLEIRSNHNASSIVEPCPRLESPST